MSKKTTLMIAVSMLLFFLFAFVDEYENLFFSKSKKIDAADPYEIEGTLNSYIDKLSRVYLDPSPELIAEMPLSDELRKELMNEVEFLKNDGRIQKLEFKKLWIQGVRPVGPGKMRVTSRENMGITYLNVSDGSIIRSIPLAAFDMSYVMESIDGRWIIIRYDEMGIQELKAGEG